MKNNFVKYIFIVFVVCLIGAAVYFIYKDGIKKENNTISSGNNGPQPTIANDLRLAIAGFDTINPILSNNKNVQDITKLVFEPLLTLDENYKLTPSLATQWSKTGDTSYVLKLREDVKWQDGTKFTAEDVQYTIDRLKDTSSIYSYNVQHVTGVEVVDQNTVKIIIDTPIPFFEYNLTFPIVSKHFYRDTNFADVSRNNVPVATGMYKIASNDGRIITLKKNESWWNNKEKGPKIETITVTVYGSMGEVYNAFKMGNLDLITTEALNIEEYIGTLGYTKKEIKGRQFDFIAINCEETILSNPEVRKAISYCIDRNRIIANLYNGKYYYAEFPLAYGNWVYTEENSSQGYNPEQTKQILIDNGWEYKYNNWQKYENYKTTRLNPSLVINSENSSMKQVAENIKASMAEAGITLKVIECNTKQYNSYLTNKNYDMILTGTNVTLSPNISTYFGASNLANYKKEEMTTLVNDMANMTDENLLKENMKKIAEMSKNDMPYINLYFNRKTIACGATLIGDVKPNNYNLFYGIEKWYRQY